MKENEIGVDQARICRNCDNLVTADHLCPLCSSPTDVNPFIPKPGSKDCYCTYCGNGPFRTTSMHLVTWNEDPYTQFEDGDLTLKCSECRKDQNE